MTKRRQAQHLRRNDVVAEGGKWREIKAVRPDQRGGGDPRVVLVFRDGPARQVNATARVEVARGGKRVR
ncbi:hypothetical protein ACFP1Z_02170 [Streptomyces gamaensis]|uniref:Uncharacterized protein n=1 Tax=Streptomyces gamaensis TaxID=1763542 RepID=A0ABW0YU23_9ACTN